MNSYSEDTLVQQTTAEYLEQQLGWESAYAGNASRAILTLDHHEVESVEALR